MTMTNQNRETNQRKPVRTLVNRCQRPQEREKAVNVGKEGKVKYRYVLPFKTRGFNNLIPKYTSARVINKNE